MVLARSPGRRERIQLATFDRHPDEAGVIAADTERHQCVVGAQRVELRRVRLEPVEILRCRHVAGGGAAAARVREARRSDRACDYVWIVARRATAQDRIAGRERDERSGRV
jgi:hypothetical protein